MKTLKQREVVRVIHWNGLAIIVGTKGVVAPPGTYVVHRRYGGKQVVLEKLKSLPGNVERQVWYVNP